MKQRERVQLLFGPYKAPALHRGNRAFCLYRDADVVVTTWTDARISWPRCRSPEHPKGGSGLLVCEELARAIRNESETAIAYWWGVNPCTVVRWRKALGVARTDPAGSRRLIQAAAQAGADGIKKKVFTEEEIEVSRQNALKNNLGQNLWHGYHGPLWTEEQLALLGTLSDRKVAKKIGRSVNGVRIMRQRLGIPNAFDGRRRDSNTTGRERPARKGK